MKKQIFWVLAGLGSFIVSLVVLAPLPVVADQIMKRNPGWEFAGVSGHLWQGAIQRLTLPEMVVNDLSWTFAPRQLLSGVLAVDLEAEVRTVQVKGECGVSILQTLTCSPLRAELDAANLPQLMPKGVRMPVGLEGSLIANMEAVSWDQQHLPVMNGRLLWDDGRVLPPVQLDLGGRYEAKVNSDVDGNALRVDVQSQDTLIVVDGEVTVQPAGEFQAELLVKASAEADPTVTAALEMLGLGAPQSDGSIRIVRKGQLPLPATSPAAD